MNAPEGSRKSERLLKDRIRHHDPYLIGGRATVFADRLLVSGLRLAPYRCAYELSELVDVKWWAHTNDGPNLALRFSDGSSVAFWVRRAGVWRFKLLELLADRPRQWGPLDENLAPAL